MSLPIKRSFSSEGGASSKRDWKMRLSLRSRSGHSVEALRGRRCASLRSAATPARTDDSGRSTPSAAHRASPSPADTPAPKKSNWEVIEHFSSNRNKKSPTAVSTIFIFVYIIRRNWDIVSSTINLKIHNKKNIYFIVFTPCLAEQK
ncbi:unnamed protein product [Parnassius mnemosyne]|uniref:Uncharacterized protein n=1 Tax=Parnassius mnemosyne TaxID=213953 RepID=A0AAV1KYP3_9NEOP